MEAAAEKAMIEGCLSGSRDAQYELYKRYNKAMYNICLRMMNDRADAEDVLQNAFVEVFSKLKYFRHESAPGAWIKKIVINQCINHLRKRKIQYSDPENLVETAYEEEGLPTVLNVEVIRRCLEQMPDGYRTIFCLYAMEGYDHGEIAEILGITEATSKSQYSRARVRLYEILKSNGNINKLYE